MKRNWSSRAAGAGDRVSRARRKRTPGRPLLLLKHTMPTLKEMLTLHSKIYLNYCVPMPVETLPGEGLVPLIRQSRTETSRFIGWVRTWHPQGMPLHSLVITQKSARDSSLRSESGAWSRPADPTQVTLG